MLDPKRPVQLSSGALVGISLGSARTPARSRTTGLLALLALLAVVSVSVLGGAGPARADEVTTAEQRVAGLQGLVRSTAVKLTAGTRRYEADQAALARAQRELKRSQLAIIGARAKADAGADRLDALAKQMYMAPAPQGLTLAFTQRPESVLDSLQMSGAVERVAGSQTDVVREAVAARVVLQGEQKTVEQLTAKAAMLAARSATTLKELNALAAATGARLESAQAALTAARARKAARIAAAKARAERAARVARERAARKAHRRLVATSRPLAVHFSGASCTGGSTSGQANGNLDPASLCPLWMAPGHRLRADAAAAFNAMSKAHAAQQGAPLCVTDSYRSYSEQVDVYRRKPGLAAVPGNSNHGWGLAVDFCGGVQRFGSDAYNWMGSNAGRFGFFHPDWAQQGGSKPEAWHWEFNG